jgi:hypothetical protein
MKTPQNAHGNVVGERSVGMVQRLQRENHLGLKLRQTQNEEGLREEKINRLREGARRQLRGGRTSPGRKTPPSGSCGDCPRKTR